MAGFPIRNTQYMMTDFKTIYTTQAAQYEALVSCEDYQGNILPALQQIRPFSGLTVVELGAGTGRLTRLLAPLVQQIHAFDLSAHMLRLGRQQNHSDAPPTWSVADNRQLPLKNKTADVVIAGWSLGHSVDWYPQSWQQEIGQALAEMKRVVRPGGCLILLETLGTGQETPHPPTAGLAAFYHWLQTAHGFNHTWIRTDYRFETAEHAAQLTRFFFGNDLADHILRENITILPECTGIWWKA